jgi:hypothetical protein
MTDVRCPMCGKTNPPQAEACQYCQARLQPVTGENDEFPWQDPADAEPEEDVPDWLKELRPPGGEEIDESEGDFGEAVGDERLSQVFQDDAQEDNKETAPPEEPDEEIKPPAEEEFAVQESGAPVWSETEDDYSTSTGQPSESEADEQDLPDWFSSYDVEQEPETPSQLELEDPSGEKPEVEDQPSPDEAWEQADEHTTGSDDPEWLVNIRKRHEAEEEEKSRLEQNSMDWLSAPPFSDIQPRPVPAQSEDEPASLEKDYGLLAPQEAEPGDESGETEPDWLARLEKASREPVESSEEDKRGIEEEQQEEELPDWLSRFSSDKTEAGEEESEEDAEIAPGDLPEWLEAMRPIDSAAPSIPLIGEEDARPEKVGPLAGLTAVIPAEPEFAEFKKPPAYSIKLNVTDHQQAHAVLLENMLETEEEGKPVDSRPLITSQVLLRLLITILLIIAILLPRWIDLSGTGLPAGVMEQSSIVHGQIEQLPPGAPVLIGFDFEPGLAAELDLTAQLLITELWQRNANLVLVSTLPVGPVNAERYIKAIAEGNGAAGRSYTNLGFIAGGPAGLRGFAENPSRVLPFSMDAVSPWTRAPLSAVETAADFAMLVVITENPEIARAWIEQVRMPAADTDMPFILVVSAQTEPLVRPYYRTGVPGQVSGLLVGWAGGASMENLLGVPGPVSANWTMFGMGLTAAAVLLLIGGLVSLIVLTLEKRKNPDHDEDAL